MKSIFYIYFFFFGIIYAYDYYINFYLLNKGENYVK